MTTWKRVRTEGMCVRTTMDWVRRVTDTRVTLWRTHKHAHTQDMESRERNAIWAENKELVKQSEEECDTEKGRKKERKKRIKKIGETVATSCCSALPWSNLRVTSCSSSGSEPCSSRALKTQRWNMWHQFVLWTRSSDACRNVTVSHQIPHSLHKYCHQPGGEHTI